MLRMKAAVVMVMMIMASTAIPFGGADGVQRDGSQVLNVETVYTLSGNETWKSVNINATGTLVVPKGYTLNAQAIRINGGSLEVPGGTIVLGGSPLGTDVVLSGRASYLNLSQGALITLNAPAGTGMLDTSQGADAMMDVRVLKSININKARIEACGGDGFSNPSPWVEGEELIGTYASGGMGYVRLGTNDTPVATVRELTVIVKGGNGGNAAHGKNPFDQSGAKGGGYSNGGAVGDRVGAGGNGTVSIGGYELSVSSCALQATGGKGGKAGNGGGLDQDASQYFGGGGGGGYSGGDGVSYYSGIDATDGGLVTGYVGAGGMANFQFTAYNLSAKSVDIVGTGGRGGDAGKGGSGNNGGGGGGGGYGGGGGGSGNYNGYGSGGDAEVDGRVGSGGNVTATLTGENTAVVDTLTMTAQGGVGGNAGNGGNGGYYEAGGGGGGYGGGGGTNYYCSGGDGTVTGEVGMGGNSTLAVTGGKMLAVNSTVLLFGGQAGNAGKGGNGGYYYGGGGGGGYGGGGGLQYADSNQHAGKGTVLGLVGHGGGSEVLFESNSGPGELVARSNKFYLWGGAGGNGGLGGTAGYYSCGGGGGYGGAGGAYIYSTGGTATVGKLVGSGGDALLTVRHVAPSISLYNSISMTGGTPGNGKTQKGAGSAGGAGNGASTVNGTLVSEIPMGVAILASPADNEFINGIPPLFNWEPIFYSSTDGDVISYTLQADNNEDFTSPEIETGVELQHSFQPTSELSAGGLYHWRVMATYMTGMTYGYGPAKSFLYNTPPQLRKSISLATFKEDTTATHLINLDSYFSDDLYGGNLTYKIIFESDPSHILGIVDGNFLSFTTPTMDWNGQERFAVRASDPLGLSYNSNNFTVRVTPVNDPPRFSPMPAITVTEGKEHVFDLAPYVSDIDSRSDTILVTTNSSFCRIEGMKLYLKYTPGTSSETVQINVSDGIDFAVADLAVTVLSFNEPPTIKAIPPPWMIILTEDSEFALDLSSHATDQETASAEILWNVTAISAGNPPLFNAFIVNRNTLRVVGSPNASGTGSIVLVAVDQQGKEDSRQVFITITPVNDAPKVSQVPEQKIPAGTFTVIDIVRYVADVDNAISDLRLSSQSPLVLTIEGLKLTVQIKPDAIESQEVVTFTVSDGQDTTTAELMVHVMFPPTIPSSVPPVKVGEDKTKSIDLTTYVLDKDNPEAALRWEVSDVNDKLFSVSIDPNTHVMKIIPKRAGRDEITITVKDPDGGTASSTVTVTVLKVEKKTEVASGTYVFAGFVVMAAVLGVVLLALRRKSPR